MSAKSEKSRVELRIARQKRVKAILQLLGYPGCGLGIVATIGLFKAGQPFLAIFTGFASIGVVFLAIAAKFLSTLELLLN